MKFKSWRDYPPEFIQLALAGSTPARFPIHLTAPNRKTYWQLRAGWYAFRSALRADPEQASLHELACRISVSCEEKSLTLTFNHSSNNPALVALSAALSSTSEASRTTPENCASPTNETSDANTLPQQDKTAIVNPELPDEVQARMRQLGLGGKTMKRGRPSRVAPTAIRAMRDDDMLLTIHGLMDLASCGKDAAETVIHDLVSRGLCAPFEQIVRAHPGRRPWSYAWWSNPIWTLTGREPPARPRGANRVKIKLGENS